VRINSSFTNVYKNASEKSEVVTQLLYGDTFKKLKKINSWIKIKNNSDSYIGFIKVKKFLANQKNTHKVSNLFANLYFDSSIKKKTKKILSFGTRIRVVKIKGKFCKFDNFWIKKKDLKKIIYKSNNIFKDVSIFVNTKYKWGGKHYSGIDCSSLVQLFLNFNNKYCPRDSGGQMKYFKKKVKLNNIKKNDLIFWKRHVAIAISKKKLIHAYGPFKKTLVMSINETIDRIYKTANLKILAIRRVT